MSSPEMASRLSNARGLLPSLSSALKTFQSSAANFEIVRTLPSDSPSQPSQPSSPSPPLYILDASFNPPSRAHLSLCNSALRAASGSSSPRLLLLFSTHNADKAPSPASFEHRLAMMSLLAEDLLASSSNKPVVDVGVTKAPYYTDKSQAIAASGLYPPGIHHIHLIGYDTLTRFLAPKYYPKFSPPLSALEPYFGAGHRVICTMRTESSSVNAVAEDSIEEQERYLQGLKDGALEQDGFKQQWAEQIEMVKADEDAVGVSSTAVRKAAQNGEWDKVEKMCTPGVAAWVREQKLYEGDVKGSKMA